MNINTSWPDLQEASRPLPCSKKIIYLYKCDSRSIVSKCARRDHLTLLQPLREQLRTSEFTWGKRIRGNIKVRVYSNSGKINLDYEYCYHAMHYSDLNPKFYFLPVLSRRWNRLRLFCKEALVAIKSYQELRESLDSMQDVLEVCSKTVDDSSNDESTLQVGLMFFNIAYVLPSQEPLAASFFVH